MSFSQEISHKRIDMTSQISFATKEMALAVKENKGDLKLKAVLVAYLPIYPLWIGFPMESLSPAVWHM